MGQIQLPKRLDTSLNRPTIKPSGPVAVDWSNPLTRGLVGCWLLDRDGCPDLCGNYEPARLSGGEFIGTDRGRALRTDNPAAFATIANFSPPPTNKGSICVDIYWRDDTGRERILGFTDAFEIQIESTNYLLNDLFQASDGNTSSQNIINQENHYSLAFTYDYPSGTGQIFTNGGDNTEASPGTCDDFPSGPATLTLGNRTGAGSGDSFNGTIYHLFVFDRVITEAEAMALHLDPYQILKPALPPFLFYPDPSAGYWIHDPRFEMPELLRPRVKPIGPVSVDWNKSITRGLVNCWLFNNSPHDLTQNAKLTEIDGDPNISGNTAHFDGDDAFEYSNSGLEGKTAATIIAAIRPDATITDSQVIIRQWSAGAQVFTLGTSTTNANSWQNGFRDTTEAMNGKISQANTLAVGRKNQIACTWQGGENKLYTDGVLDDSTTDIWTSTLGTLKTVATPVVIGASYDGASNSFYFTGDIEYVFLFDRVLSAAEIKSLSNDPYQFLIPK